MPAKADRFTYNSTCFLSLRPVDGSRDPVDVRITFNLPF